MALRFHFPCGLLLTVLGYSALAAGAAWLQVVDFDGHFYRQLALHAAGGAMLGALGWTFSERIAYAANLNTQPLLRLLLGGILASYAAAWVAGPYTELMAGAASLVAPVVAALLFVAAGILPLVATVALIAVLETLLSAQRGGIDMASSLRPMLATAALGIVLGAVTGFAAWSMRDQIISTVLALAPDVPRTSGWIDRRRALFSAVLQGEGCEVLVIPFEPTPPSAGEPARSLDRPARSLMTRELAAQIHAQTGMCVADPTLVARALGESAREIRGTAVWKLGDAIGASWIVRGSVELDPEQHAYALTLALFARGSGKRGRWAPAQSAELGPVVFSDELPPEIAFNAIASAAAAQLGLPTAGGSAQDEAASAPREFPPSPLGLAADPGSALERARRLQLLAATYPRTEVGGEHLWERSLMALRGPDALDEASRVARARAALHLYRRPYAVQLLRGLRSAEARALFALAQGNLTQAETIAAQIAEPAIRIIIEVELEEARLRYGRTTGFRERRDAMLKQFPGYAPLLHAVLSSEEWFQPTSHELVQHQLAALGVALEDGQLAAQMRAIAASIGQDMFVSSELARRAVAVERSYAPLWQTHAASWRAQRAFDRLAEWDYYDALYAANRTALANPAVSLQSRRGQAVTLLEYARDLGAPFAGYPPLAAGVVSALKQQQQESSAPDVLLNERSRRLLRDLIAWEGGESELVRNVQPWLPATSQAAYADEPPRAWRPVLYPPPRDAGDAPLEPGQLEQNLAHQLRALEYSQYGFARLLGAYESLRLAGRYRDAQQLAAHAQDRFIGNPERENFLLALAEESGDMATYVAILEQSIGERSEDWNAYNRLARAQLAARHAEQAQRTLLAFPPFRSEKANPATLANQANVGGDLLLYAGETHLARPLYQLSAQYATESAPRMRSQLRLAQLDGRWKQVRDLGRQLYEQFKDPWGITCAASASFLIGEPDQGFRTFFEGSKQIEDMRPWWAAIAGHRIAATSEDELIGFARRWKALSGDAAVENALRDHFLFNALIIDRAASDKTVQSLIVMTERNGDAVYRNWIAGYAAFKRSNFSAAADSLGPLVAQDPGRSEIAKATTAPALPYAVASLMKSGRVEQARALRDSTQQRLGRDFHVLLASAYVQGLSNDPAQALHSLWQANLVWPSMSEATISPPYQLLETCEKLLEWTGDERYRLLLLDLAHRERENWPWSWAYVFQAKHSKDAAEREHALAMAAFLDPQSEHLSGFSEAQRKSAVASLERSHPFRKQ